MCPSSLQPTQYKLQFLNACISCVGLSILYLDRVDRLHIRKIYLYCIYLFILCVSLCVYVSLVYVFVCMHLCLSVCRSVSLHMYLCVYVYGCICVCVCAV